MLRNQAVSSAAATVAVLLSVENVDNCTSVSLNARHQQQQQRQWCSAVRGSNLLRETAGAHTLLSGVSHWQRRYSSAMSVTGLSRRAHTSSHFRPFSAEDEAQLTAVLATKPRHVARHIRQSMLYSRRRIMQFRNSVTYLMILLQSRLQKKQISPEDATAIVEGLMRECVELRQGDMAHLLFRASLRFRKYGLRVNYPLVRHLYDSYRFENARDLMKSMADELRSDEELRLLAVLAYLFSGDHVAAMALLREIPTDQLTTDDYCALLEGLGMTAKYRDVRDITMELVQRTGDGGGGHDGAGKHPGVNEDAIISAAIVAVRGDPELFRELSALAVERKAALSEAAMGTLLRVRLASANVTCVADVYDTERALRDALGVTSLGMAAETAVIGRCSELLSRNHDRGDEVMLHKVQHLREVLTMAIECDQVDDLDSSYALTVIKGFGALGRFEEMRQCFNALKEAGAIKDHRLYDEMLRWYANAFNLKEVIALKEEMSNDNVYHTASTYHNVFRVLDKYYPRMVEKYLGEMRSKGMQIEGFMYPTLIRVFGALQDNTMVESLYREAKSKAAQGNSSALTASTIIQMLRWCQGDTGRCDNIIRDAESYGLLTHELVQAEIVQFYSVNDRHEEQRAFLSRVPYKSPTMYRVLLRDASKRKNRREFQALLVEMRENQVKMNERLFSVVVTSLAQFGDAEGVRAHVHKALASDEVHSALFFADTASAYERLGDAEAVTQCWKDLLDSKMVITMPVYNRFLDLYMNNNNMTMVQEILDTMMRLVPPNPVTATTVVDMLGKMGRLTEMEAVLDEMSRSTNAAPTLVTYHQAMNAYAKCGEVPKMEAMRERLKADGFRENHVTYNIMFECYGRAKRYEQLQELVAERKDKGVGMEEFGYVVLLNIYARARMATETETLVSQMVESGTEFSSRMLATVASSFSAVGDVAQMERYVSLLLSHPDSRLRDVESVYIIYSRLRDTVRLQELLDTEKLPKSELIYNICVSAFAKAGEHVKVAHLLTEMEAKSYTLSRNTSVTLSSLLLKAGKLQLAQSVLKWKGVKPIEELSASSPTGGDGTEAGEGEHSDDAGAQFENDEVLQEQLKAHQ